MVWQYIGASLSVLSNILLVILAVYFFRYLSKEIKILLVLFALTFMIEFTSILIYLAEDQVNTVWLSHLVTLVQYVFFLWVFSLWQKEPLVRKGLLISIPVFVLIWIVAKFWFEDFSHFDNYTATTAALVLTGISAYTLFQISAENTGMIFDDTRFWIAAGVLLYFTGNLFFLALINDIIKFLPPNYVRLVWSFQWVVTVTANILYGGGVLCQQPR